jgi:hypothetical protein
MKFNPEEHIYKPAEDIKFWDKIGLSEKELQEVKADVTKQIIKKNESIGTIKYSIEKEWGKRGIEMVKTTYALVFNELISRGVEKVKLSDTQMISHADPNLFGISEISKVTINYDRIKNIEDTEIRLLNMVTHLAHELYHSSAPTQILITEDIKNKNNRILIQDASGASYWQGNESKEFMLLEEGAAVDFEETIFTKISKEFNENTLKLHGKIKNGMNNNINTNYSKDIINNIYPPAYLTNLKKVDNHNYDYKFSISMYGSSHQILLLLKDKIPDFYHKLEKARIERKPLDLTRDIEKQFGEGMYRRLTTATIEDANALLTELKQSISK